MSCINRILSINDTSILYEITPGKPDPRQKKVPGVDLRDRIRQKSQPEANGCQYYVLNYLRERIGKNFSPEFTESRAVELACSTREKENLKNENAIRHILADMTGTKKMEFLSIEQLEETVSFLDELFEKKLITGIPQVDLNVIYNQKVIKRIEVNEKFLKTMEVDIKSSFESEYVPRNGYATSLTWSDYQNLTLEEKNLVLEKMSLKVMAEKYGLVKAQWMPSQPIECLIQELKEYGPIAFAGVLDTLTYQNEPGIKKTIENRKIYGWEDNCPILKQMPRETHTCLMVGAEKKEAEEYVYFIDPRDPSDPADVECQKIYVVSYEIFKSQVVNLHGQFFSQKYAVRPELVASPTSQTEYGYRRGVKTQNIPT